MTRRGLSLVIAVLGWGLPVWAAPGLTDMPPEPLPDPSTTGGAAATAQRRYEACALAALQAPAPDLSAAQARAAAVAAEARCAAERAELRTMALFDFRLHADAAARADRHVTTARAQLIDALTRQLLGLR